MSTKRFEPCKAPNNKIDNALINWHERILVPNHWDTSLKLDGIRLEIMFDRNSKCTILTRNMKPFRSVFIKRLAQQLDGCLRDCIVEAEIYCDYMRFNELQHFIMSIDVFTHLTRMRRLEQRVHSDMFKQVTWPFPGRTAAWLCTYDHPFTINVFDIHKMQNERWVDRKDKLQQYLFNRLYQRSTMFRLVQHYRFETVNQILLFYDNAIDSGEEGLILKHDSHRYKYGRNTVNEAQLFKMKDDHREYVGEITGVLQGTMVDPMIEGGVNELGYATTSQKAEDRMPNGKCKGFEVVLLSIGANSRRKLTVTLKGFTDIDKREILKNKNKWIGKSIVFNAMKPTKVNGVPRHAKYIKK